ncbi:calcium-binding protein [Paracoccus aestuariivivens]|nr:calcium-binding protein [Paracoccus aestuariivivens]
MRIVNESASQDLSGGTLFPNLYPEYGDFSTIRSSSDYLVSSLSLGTMTEAFLQVSDGAVQDVDTFVMHLDAGDTYQIVFSSAETEQFLSNRGMTVFGADGDYVALILNNYGNTFSATGTLTSLTFTAETSGDYLLFSSFYAGSVPVTASYGLTLERVEDVTPWDISLNRDGMGAKAIIASGDETIAAGARITMSLSFATSNVTFDDVRMLVSGSMSTGMSSSNHSTTIWITMSPAQAVNMRDLLEVSFTGGGSAGSVEVSSVSVQVAGASTIVDIGEPVSTPGHQVLTGTAGNEVLSGDIGNDRLSGLAGDDTLTGVAGNDTLNGGAGRDRMIGGQGNDVYVIDNASDIVLEYANQGTDFVQSTISYSLAGNVENLTLLGTAALSGTGNALSNLINGNAGNNLLSGLAGNDTLNGRLGSDRMSGGTGNDTYIVDNAGDVVIEAAGEGIDLVQSAVSHALRVNVENLTLLGTGNLAGSGNAATNLITGNAGNNRLSGLAGNDTINGGSGNDILDGGAGTDRMSGGAGNDVYRVDAIGDLTLELAGQGTDLVQSAVNYALRVNVENLTLLGTGNLAGSGNATANLITGNAGNNRLSGLAGNDTINGGFGNDVLDGGLNNDRLNGGIGNDRLIGGAGSDHISGGAGADRFVFVSLSESTVGVAGRDTITDFSRGQQDLIDLSAIDANFGRTGNQAFSFIGDAAFTGQAGQLSARTVTGGTLVSGDVNGDRIADFAVLLDDRLNLGTDCFIL